MKTNNLARNYGSFNLSTSFRNVAGSAGSFAAALIASKAVSVYRYADLLVEVVTRRYEKGKSIVLTTNKPFAEWPAVFPNAACVVTLVDRLLHRAELVVIEAESYRLREAQERQQRRTGARRRPKEEPITT